MADDKLFNLIMFATRQINACYKASVTDVRNYIRQYFCVPLPDCEFIPFIEGALNKAACLGYLCTAGDKYFISNLCPPDCPPPCPGMPRCPMPAPGCPNPGPVRCLGKTGEPVKGGTCCGRGSLKPVLSRRILSTGPVIPKAPIRGLNATRKADSLHAKLQLKQIRLKDAARSKVVKKSPNVSRPSRQSFSASHCRRDCSV